jgi:hypothetical protein
MCDALECAGVVGPKKACISTYTIKLYSQFYRFCQRRRTNATRDGAYSGTACSAFRSSAAAGSDAVLIATNRADRTLISAVEAVPEVQPSGVSIASRDFQHGVACGHSQGLPTGANIERNVFTTAVLTKSCAESNPVCSLAGRNTSSRSLGSQDSRIDRPFASLTWRIADHCRLPIDAHASPGRFYARGVRCY